MLLNKFFSQLQHSLMAVLPSPKRGWVVLGGIVTLLFLVACTGNKVYDSYEQTPVAGWEKNDTLTFGVPPMEQEGIYQMDLGLRINGSYPFMGLTLIVEQLIVHSPDYCKARHLPQIGIVTDTLTCKLIDEQGRVQGQGLSYYQYDFPVSEVELQKGDSIYVKVWHDMKREILPGVSDIGIRYFRRSSTCTGRQRLPE